MKKSSQIHQMGLFGEDDLPPPSTDALADTKWSYSRRAALEQCPRRYYSEYFGANKRTAPNEPAKDQLHFLKAVANRHERTGAILHIALSAYFRKAQASEPWDILRLTSFAQSIFRRDVAYSREHPDDTPPARKGYPPVLLREFHYHALDAETLCAEAEDRLIAAIEAFGHGDQFAEFRRAGSTAGALIEHTATLPDFPYAVTGKVDLAYAQDDRVTIVDWKLGASHGSGDESLQLAFYGLWALDHFRCYPSALRICKAHLGSRDIVDFTVTADTLAAARARIIQDVERMGLLQRYGRDGIAAAFTPCLQPAVCGLCSFERVCYAGN